MFVSSPASWSKSLSLRFVPFGGALGDLGRDPELDDTDSAGDCARPVKEGACAGLGGGRIELRFVVGCGLIVPAIAIGNHNAEVWARIGQGNSSIVV